MSSILGLFLITAICMIGFSIFWMPISDNSEHLKQHHPWD
jgi:hypothetical protein